MAVKFRYFFLTTKEEKKATGLEEFEVEVEADFISNDPYPGYEVEIIKVTRDGAEVELSADRDRMEVLKEEAHSVEVSECASCPCRSRCGGDC